MQRTDEAQAELGKYHALCTELSHKLSERGGVTGQGEQHDETHGVAEGVMETRSDEEAGNADGLAAMTP